jgi:squalene-hopene/tetraprenyl-beta-curcumene cyclase
MSALGLQLKGDLLESAHQALERASAHLLGKQHSEGYWWAELTADSTLESDYILLLLWMYPPRNGVWDPPCGTRVDRTMRYILERQLEDGGWNIFHGGPSEISATVKAYFALKVGGLPASDSRMRRACQRILALGGIQAANSYTKINLSLFGQYPREFCPAIPPEVMLLPGNIIYQMSSWTRAILIPLSIVHSSDPKKPVPEGFNLDELWLPGVSGDYRRDNTSLTWRNFFLQLDQLLKWWEKQGSKDFRQRGIKAAEQWMLERFDHSDGLGAIYPPMMYAIMALDVLGYAVDDPIRMEAIRQFERLLVDDGKRFFFQPCFSAVWDTAIAAYALNESGQASTAALTRAADWLLAREIRRKGDWAMKRPNTEPSGWVFEFRNEFYPDIDDTAMVMLALSHLRGSRPPAQYAAHARALQWMLDMQSTDGGWAAFDVDNDWEFLSFVPFADHNAMLDPTCPDITGRVLEALAAHGIQPSHDAVRRGVAYLVRAQEADGSWYGRWGVAYIYGTCFALRGLAASGESDREAHMLRATEWLRAIQNADGGWGESCTSYDNGVFTPATSTPSQTAWALMGLIAGGDTASESVRKGIDYLVSTQRSDGEWDQEAFTGTGFPKVFYLNYHLYRLYFPLIALASFVKAGGAQPERK